MRRVTCIEEVMARTLARRRARAIERLDGMRAVHQRARERAAGVCEYCGVSGEVKDLKECRPMSNYNWDGLRGVNPNGPLTLCADCAEDLRNYWDDMWGQYYSDIM